MAIAFVLHGLPDQQYAAALAEALAPIIALPTPFPQRDGAQFGSGAACIVVWSANPGAGAQDVCSALAHCNANVVVCRIGAAPTPVEFTSAQFLIIEGAGEAGRDVVRIREAIADIDDRLAAPHTLKLSRLASPALSSAPAHAPVAEKADKRLAVRSAYGLAATLAVVGFMAPSIGQRAVATGIDPSTAGSAPRSAAPPSAQIPSQAQAPAPPSDAVAPQRIAGAAHRDSLLVDHWLAPPIPFTAERLETPDSAALIDYAPPSDEIVVAGAEPDGQIVLIDNYGLLSLLNSPTEAAKRKLEEALASERDEATASGEAASNALDLKRNN